jgi:c-di-GMP-binding flagellar brake protein YcgR
MFEDTRPAELNASGEADAWAAFRVGHPQERLALLRQLRDGAVPVLLGGPDGATLATTLWALDDQAQRLGFLVDPASTALQALIDADEAVAVAYLDSVKLQFDLAGLVLVRGVQASTLQCALPQEIYRFQRRAAYRVRPGGRQMPLARLRHPAIPEMALALRVIDISVGGCALWLPADVPPLQAGTRIGELVVELDHETRFAAAATLQHVTGMGEAERGVRIGCEWQPLAGPAARTLQRWIDQAQKRRRLLSVG